MELLLPRGGTSVYHKGEGNSIVTQEICPPPSAMDRSLNLDEGGNALISSFPGSQRKKAAKNRAKPRN
jgi:hypothetical protein